MNDAKTLPVFTAFIWAWQEAEKTKNESQRVAKKNILYLLMTKLNFSESAIEKITENA